jgi:hypothetical protein
MKKMRKTVEKCGLNIWDLENRPFVLTVVREWAKKLQVPNQEKNIAEKTSHQLWPIPMKIGSKDILREHFGFFFFFNHLYESRSQKKYPKYPETNQYIWVNIQGFLGKNAEKCGKCGK